MAKINLSGVEAAEAPTRYFHVDRRGTVQEHSPQDHESAMVDAFEKLGYPRESVPEIMEGIQILMADGMPEKEATFLMLGAAKGSGLKRSPVEMARHIVKLRKSIR